MIKVFVDSGSSIKPEEQESLGVEILPLQYLIEETNYRDGFDISTDEFYKILIEKKVFPKTSLPNLEDAENRVTEQTKQGHDVVVLTISAGISGTFNALTNLFADNPKVKVLDSGSAVGAMRILVTEINKNLDKSLEEVEQIVKNLIPKIQILAIPETLNYLFKGGRLSRREWLFGSMLNIKPIIGFKDGYVKVIDKKIGLKNGMKYIVDSLKNCDTNYPIVPSYTYNPANLEELIKLTPEEYKKSFTVFDNLTPSLGCHWGPNAFGYIYVSK